MSDAIRIERHEEGRRGRYVARLEGVEGEAELVYTRRGAGLISADHTGTPESMRGSGAAQALVLRIIADARAEGFKIVPICPYVQAQARKHPEWSDVIAPSPGA